MGGTLRVQLRATAASSGPLSASLCIAAICRAHSVVKQVRYLTTTGCPCRPSAGAGRAKEPFVHSHKVSVRDLAGRHLKGGHWWVTDWRHLANEQDAYVPLP